MLTREQIAELRRPFRADQTKWKIQTQPKGEWLEGWGVVVAYLDARDVAERLDLVVGGEWHNAYTPFGQALECALTVCGVTRRDVGEGEGPKELYSDAFKRAAVLFGVGAFLYRLPSVMAKLSRKDVRKPWGLTDEARRSLRAIAEAVEGGRPPAARYPGLMLLSEYQAPETGREAEGALPQATEPDRSKDDLPIGPHAPRLDAELRALGIADPLTYAAQVCRITDLADLATLTVRQARQVKHTASGQAQRAGGGEAA